MLDNVWIGAVLIGAGLAAWALPWSRAELEATELAALRVGEWVVTIGERWLGAVRL